MFENIIRKQLNADEQETAAAPTDDGADATTATTNAPVEDPDKAGLPVQKKRKKSITVCMTTRLCNWTMDK